MSSSDRLRAVTVLLGVALLPASGAAQDAGRGSPYEPGRAGEDRAVVERAMRLYNQATRMEEEALAAGAGADADITNELAACTAVARESFDLRPSKMAAWRVASCASGAAAPVSAWLAFRAFEALEPAGLLAWRPPSSFDVPEVTRVHAAFGRVEREVGGVLIRVVPADARIEWDGGAPEAVHGHSVPALRRQLVEHDGVVYAALDTAFSVTVAADGYRPETRAVRFRPLRNGVEELVITLDREVPAPAAAPPVVQATESLPPRSGAGRPSRDIEANPSRGGGGSSLRVIGWGTAGLGVAAAGVGAVLWGLANGIESDLDRKCPDHDACDPDLRGDYDRGRTFTTVGNVAVPVGVGLLGVGVALLVLGSSSSSADSADVNLAVGPGSASLVGSF